MEEMKVERPKTVDETCLSNEHCSSSNECSSMERSLVENNLSKEYTEIVWKSLKFKNEEISMLKRKLGKFKSIIGTIHQENLKLKKFLVNFDFTDFMKNQLQHTQQIEDDTNEKENTEKCLCAEIKYFVKHLKLFMEETLAKEKHNFLSSSVATKLKYIQIDNKSIHSLKDNESVEENEMYKKIIEEDRKKIQNLENYIDEHLSHDRQMREIFIKLEKNFEEFSNQSNERITRITKELHSVEEEKYNLEEELSRKKIEEFILNREYQNNLCELKLTKNQLEYLKEAEKEQSNQIEELSDVIRANDERIRKAERDSFNRSESLEGEKRLLQFQLENITSLFEDTKNNNRILQNQLTIAVNSMIKRSSSFNCIQDIKMKNKKIGPFLNEQQQKRKIRRSLEKLSKRRNMSQPFLAMKNVVGSLEKENDFL
ncbi:hypothetical protein SNEBB_005079, partial [Seison nebaliae]